MLDRFYYESSDKAYTVKFGQDGLYVRSNDVRDYAWTYTEADSILSFKNSLGKKKLPLLFAKESRSKTAQERDRVFYIFERDVKLNKMGRIWINGFYMNCYVIEGKNKGIIRTRFLQTEFTIVSDGVWHKDTTYRFIKQQEARASSTGMDYPHDIPYDLGYKASSNRVVIKNDCIVDSDFIMTIYGAAVDPLVEINGHKYKINGTLLDVEHLIITNVTGEKHSIVRYAQDGTSTDWFGRRYKEESIFEKIPEGNIAISWDGSFGFDLQIISSRSEPLWWDGEEEKAPEITEVDYLTDSDGNYLVDSDGFRIEVA